MALAPRAQRAGIVLAGGKSTRMGVDKRALTWAGESLLARVVRTVSTVVERVVVVAGNRAQEFSELPATVATAHDERPGLGPLAGLCAGLKAVGKDYEATFVVGCDVPLIRAATVERMFALLSDHQCAVLRTADGWQPLGAVYRVAVLETVVELLAVGERRLTAVIDRTTTRAVRPEELSDVDPRLETWRGCNTPAEFAALLAEFNGGSATSLGS